MSKRRRGGETVWMSATPGCVGSPRVEQGAIEDERRVDWTGCLLDCGDEDCREWANVLVGDHHCFHVPECQMFDTREEAEAASC